MKINYLIILYSIWINTNLREINAEVFGCGGFVQSQYPLDLNRVEIKLYIKQGENLNLKLRTECAPTTGYYFMPIESKGNYVIKISPPDGWNFEPSEHQIEFDGKYSEKCGIDGVDLNFVFSGFSITGQILTESYKEGPENALLTLTGTNNLFLKTRTKLGGHFLFEKVPPGKYIIKSSHSGVTYSKDAFEFELKENLHLDEKIIVTGYEIKGRVTSDGTGVKKVTLVLLSETNVQGVQGCVKGKPKQGFQLPSQGPNHVICHQTSDDLGVYRFKNVKPGQYTVIPVYTGRNIVYSLSPERRDLELGQASIELQDFQVDGFSVIGKVKGVSDATIFVNGEARVVTDKDGSFTLPKMKQGTYLFEVTAEKFQFEAKEIKIEVSNPILPVFEPSKFLVCGSVKLVHLSNNIQLYLNFVNEFGKKVQREKVSLSSPLCYFLPAGKFKVTIDSTPETFFTPESSAFEVPSSASSTSAFAFTQFTGSISGRVKCQSSDGTISSKACNDLKVVLLVRSNTGEYISTGTEQEVKGDGKFKFINLESGDYQLETKSNNYELCWKENRISIQLKQANIENVDFVQTGYGITIISTHSTLVKIFMKKFSGNDIKTTLVEEVKLIGQNEPKNICLKKFSSDGYSIEPISCHKFEKMSYEFSLGKGINTRVELIATEHQHEGTIETNAPITEIQIRKNGELLDLSNLPLRKGTGSSSTGKYIYDFQTFAKSGETFTLQFFSYDFTFQPSILNLVGGDDCQSRFFTVVGQKSHVIKGRLVPAIENVEIRIEPIGDPEATAFARTDSKGEYIAGPFIHSQGFKVTPKLAGYNFKPFGDGYSFNALKWAKIHVKVAHWNEAEIPIQSVLLSLSGPNSYRQNKLTDQKGEIMFTDLHPGTYFLKALLKEFSFEPSAFQIQLSEQETKEVKLKGKKESFSLFGQVNSLSGEVMPNLVVTAKGQGNCSEYGEEGISDEGGNFRIWSLKSYCIYRVSVGENKELVDRTIPTFVDKKIGNEDVHNLTFAIIQPVRRMDISLRCSSNNARDLESLRAVVYNTKSVDSPLFSVPFNGVSYIILPPIPKDYSSYIIRIESTLNPHNFQYDLPTQINFTAKESYAHFSFDFNVIPIHHEPEIGKSSYFAFAFIIIFFIIILNFERLSIWIKELVTERFWQSGFGLSLTSFGTGASNRNQSTKKSIKTKSQ